MRPVLFIVLLLGLFQGIEINSQSLDIKLKLVDHISLLPVENAHIFIENTTYGAISDKDGSALFSIPAGLSEDLFISHVSYETKILKYYEFTLSDQDVIVELVPSSLQLETMTISARRSNKWKKQFKKFRKAFLGSDDIAKSCKIVNPEVLRFEETNKKFTATAVDLIQIENQYLGYEIHYLLTGFEILKDGSSKYRGQARFIDKSNDSRKDQVTENREDIYLKSPKYYFKSLIDNKIEEAGFHTAIMTYENGEFSILKEFVRDEVLNGPSRTNKYTLEFKEFLRVYNENSRSFVFSDTGVRPGGLESQRFSSGIREEKSNENFDISYIYKISPYVILDQFGNILNSADIKEYGAWASQKLAHQLPFDYGNDYVLIKHPTDSTKIPEGSSQLSDKDKYALLISVLYETDPEKRQKTFDQLSRYWENGFAAPLIEILRLTNDQELLQRLNKLLKEKYGHNTPKDYYDWMQWLWDKDIAEEEYYYNLKSELYKHIDPIFELYFKDRHMKSSIKLDEVLWGGVRQDGIPPLRSPELLDAGEAVFLNDKDIVFGVYINGIARAYPKRILAWHEFFTDQYDDLRIAGVYCTLCGTVIVYDMTLDNVFHDLGTSGFLYRSNKLMYDKATQSLWSTIDGKPVIGDLVGKNISLHSYPVVTTSWKEWKHRHPETKVLSINTGYKRNYNEGVAYNEYFSTDELMFPVPSLDNRLKNKDEVFVIRAKGFKKDPLAVSLKYLAKKKWHQTTIANEGIIIIADKSGAARAYESKELIFKSFDKEVLLDQNNTEWYIHEEYLISKSGKRLNRLPAHNIFWFAWYSAYPNTRLTY